MSRVAFCFMGGGGLCTAIGSRIVGSSNLISLYTVYGIGLLILIFAVLLVKKSFIVISLQQK
ncbi:MAG: hypothetical protein WA131_11885 [Desulfitobacteriaceae bacterium]